MQPTSVRPVGDHQVTQSYATHAFKRATKANPLNGLLGTRDQDRLWALLETYNKSSRTSNQKSPLLPLEQAAKLVASAARLAAALQSEVFDGPASVALYELTSEFRELPVTLTRFSTRIGDALDSLGKAGHKTDTMATLCLVEASELVHLLTGQFHDEDLAGLLQVIPKRVRSKNLSGDGIRKKREYLKKQNPRAYLSVIDNLKAFNLSR